MSPWAAMLGRGMGRMSMRIIISGLSRLAAMVSGAVMMVSVLGINRHDLMGTPTKVCMACGAIFFLSLAIDWIADGDGDEEW